MTISFKPIYWLYNDAAQAVIIDTVKALSK